jgi:hypothetical protein
MKTRREVLVTIAAAQAVAQEVRHPHPGHDPEGGGKSGSPKLLRLDEVEALALLVDLIIPRSDTPGARDAGAHLIIDALLLQSKQEAQTRFRRGLAPFIKLGESAKLDRLRQLHQERDPFFIQLKELTIDAYYSTREGLQTELGWHGYSPLAEFPGCTHPEHKG